MSDERRYDDADAEEIFDLAVRGERTSPTPSSGTQELTLAQLQSIGQEAGIDPSQVVAAAATLEARGRSLPQRASVGMPVSVGRVLQLRRPLSDREWEIVVADLRDTFGAPGTVGRQGAAREWRNGNLRVLLEPTESGHQIRMTTTNGRLMRLNWFGLAGLTTSLVFLAVLLPDLFAVDQWSFRTLLGLLPTFLLGAAGGGALVYNRMILPRWANERDSQMEAIAARVRALTADAVADDVST